MITDITTAQDLVDALLQLREERADLDAKEAFLKEQLAGAIALGELDQHQVDDERQHHLLGSRHRRPPRLQTACRARSHDRIQQEGEALAPGRQISSPGVQTD